MAKNRIVIVDDDPDFLSWLKFGLEHKGGFEVLTAELAKEAMVLVRTQKPDLMIVDIKLPDEDGFGLCRKIKELNPAVPVILVTGVFKEHEYKEKGYNIGADDFLVKPFSYEQLNLRVSRQLAKVREDIR